MQKSYPILRCHVRYTSAEKILNDSSCLGDFRITKTTFEQRKKQRQKLVTILLNSIIQIKRLHKGRRIYISPFTRIELRKEPSKLVQNRVLVQETWLSGKYAFAKGLVHVQALEYAIGIACSSEVCEPRRRFGRFAKIRSRVRPKSLNDLRCFLPQSGFPASIWRRDKPTKAVRVIFGINTTPLTNGFPYSIKRAYIILSYFTTYVNFPEEPPRNRVSPMKTRPKRQVSQKLKSHKKQRKFRVPQHFTSSVNAIPGFLLFIFAPRRWSAHFNN